MIDGQTPSQVDAPATFHDLLQEAVQAFPQVDHPSDQSPNACAGHLVEWYADWRERVKAALRAPGPPGLAARYLASRGTRCPFCGSTQIEGAEVNTGNGEATQEMSCLSCEQAWLDTYRLTGILLEPNATVTCSLCHQPTSSETAHLHQDEWIGEECWDERLRASE